MKLLLAEDEPHIAKLIEFKLKLEGYSLTWVPDGRSAIEKFGESNWALVILDVMMPHADGWEVLKHIRSSAAAGANTPVLMLTAKGQTEDQLASASLGATRLLKKPFDPAELALVVNQLTGKVKK
jgi:DNA-binding response OmpR family regulator